MPPWGGWSGVWTCCFPCPALHHPHSLLPRLPPSPLLPGTQISDSGYSSRAGWLVGWLGGSSEACCPSDFWTPILKSLFGMRHLLHLLYMNPASGAVGTYWAGSCATGPRFPQHYSIIRIGKVGDDLKWFDLTRLGLALPRKSSRLGLLGSVDTLPQLSKCSLFHVLKRKFHKGGVEREEVCCLKTPRLPPSKTSIDLFGRHIAQGPWYMHWFWIWWYYNIIILQ